MIPDASSDDASVPRHPGHLTKPGDRVGHVVDDQLRQGTRASRVPPHEAVEPGRGRSECHVGNV